MSIIAFIPSAGLEVTFPIRFDEYCNITQEGNVLILLDDDRYLDNVINGNTPALVIQHHNTSQQTRELQIQTLENWGWEPTLIDKFSRVKETFPFWREVLALLDSNTVSEVKIAILRGMQERFSKVHDLCMLDAFCAWQILNILSPDSEEIRSQFSFQYHRLRSELQARVYEGGEYKILDNANIIAAELMA